MDTTMNSGSNQNYDDASSTRISILFVEDKLLFCKIMCEVLSRQPDFRVLEGVHSGEAALIAIERFLPNVVLLDLKLIGSSLDGVPLLREILRRFPLTRVVILSGHIDDELILDAMNNGAQGYLSKDARPDEVFDAIRAADRGHFHVDSFIARKILGIMQRMKVAPHKSAELSSGADHTQLRDLNELLTEREKDVVQRLTRGLTYQQIGNELFIAHSTVKTHVSSILTKMGLGDRRSIPLWLAHNGYRL